MMRLLMTRSISRMLLFGLLLLAVVLYPNAAYVPLAHAAAAVDADSGLPARTAQDIAAEWRKLMQPSSDPAHPYVTAPSASAPYAAGVLKSDYLKDGLNALNFYRYISGLPGDIAATDALNQSAAYGAVLLAAEGEFSHEPGRPADMPQSFYDKGLESTTTANIFGSYGYDNHILAASIEAYMEDSDEFNLDRLGHRRWILNPPLQKVGMGLARGQDEYDYATLQVFDDSRSERVGFHYIPYPARGAFPIEVFGGTTAWSVSVNPLEYATPELKSVKVTLTRMRDGKIWRFDSGANKVTAKGNYFNVETQKFGSGPAIIFRPDSIAEYAAGEQFDVRIEGLKGKDGSDRTIAYSVNFVSAADPASNPPAPSAPKFTDIAGHWARQTIEWAADRGIASGFPGGAFQPDGKVTEEQFVLMFTVAMGTKLTPSGHWSDVYYDYGAEHGYSLSGLKDADVRSKPINRAAVAELFASAAGHSLSGNDAVRFMLDNGYSKQASVADYRGKDTLTRAEAVQFIKNALDADYSI